MSLVVKVSSWARFRNPDEAKGLKAKRTGAVKAFDPKRDSAPPPFTSRGCSHSSFNTVL